MTTHKTLREKFMVLDSMRQDILDKAFEQSQFTIPRLYPDRYYQGRYDVRDMPELYSSKAGNNAVRLANTMVSALMPPNDVPFYEFTISTDLPEEQAEVLRNPVAEVERKILDILQGSNIREKIYGAILSTVVMGDALLQQTSLDKFKLYHPAHFILRRDGDGDIKEYYTVDWVVTELLDDDLKNLNQGKPRHQANDSEPLYTYIRKDGEEWKVEREFRDVKYETDKSYEILPYYHFGWNPVAGEDYSRALVEDNMGTIRSLEMVCKALAEGLAAGSEGRILIDPASTSTEDDFLGTTNWSFISARPGSVDTWQPNTVQSVGTALQAKAVYEKELDEAFLSTSASDLRGERVTAYQINQVSSERAQGIGGTLSVLEEDLKQIVYRTLFILIQENEVSEDLKDLIDEGAVTISISSGVDALGRQADVLRLEQLLRIAAESQNPEMQQVLNYSSIMRAFARNSGLDMDQFTFSQEQLDEKNAAAQQAQIQQQAAQQTIQSAGKIAEQSIPQG